MAFKTLIRHLLSQWGVLSIEMQTAITSDNAVINENGEPSYVEYEEAELGAVPESEAADSGNTEADGTPDEQEQFDFFQGAKKK